MTENMKKFLETVSKNKELTIKVGTLGKDEIITLAKELGIELAEVDFEKSMGEIDDDELDAVVGGDYCGCTIAGGGTKDYNEKACACVMGGGGEMKNGVTRCVCVYTGVGLEGPYEELFELTIDDLLYG